MEFIDFHCLRGATFSRRLIFRSAEQQVIDLSGSTAACQIRPEAGSQTLTAALSCLVDGSSGTLTLSLSAAQTAMILPGTYVYDLCLMKDGIVTYYIGGRFVIHPSVTIPEENDVPDNSSN